MNDNADDDLTEAQCRVIHELTGRLWSRLGDHSPEVIANVISNLIAEFLGRWGHGHPPAVRRQMQMEIVLAMTHVTFDLLDIRAATEGRKAKATKPH